MRERERERDRERQRETEREFITKLETRSKNKEFKKSN